MTIQEKAERLRQQGMDLREKKILLLAATGTMAEVGERIWGRGELTNGSKLKYDDDYEIWAYANTSPKKPSGKGKHGAKIKGGYYANYTAYKAGMGRPDLPFELFGHLREAWYGGALPTPTEKSPLQVVIVLDQKNKSKADGLTAKKGPFLKHSEKEIQSHVERLRRIYAREVLGK